MALVSLLNANLNRLWAATPGNEMFAQSAAKVDSALTDIAQGYLHEPLVVSLTGPASRCLLLCDVQPMSAFSTVKFAATELDKDAAAEPKTLQFRSQYAKLAGLGDETTPLCMSVASAVRALMNPQLQIMAELESGPVEHYLGSVQPLRWYHPQEHGTVVYKCVFSYTIKFLEWLLCNLMLPTVRRVLYGVTNASAAILAASNSEMFDAIKLIHYNVQMSLDTVIAAYCARVAREESKTLQMPDVESMKNLLTDISHHYLKWRYLMAPLVREGAHALMAYLNCAEPIAYTGVSLKLTGKELRLRVTEERWQTFMAAEMGDGTVVEVSPAQTMQFHYALRIATQFTNLPYSDRVMTADSSQEEVCIAVLMLLLQRLLGLGHISAEFAQKMSFGAVRDLSAFLSHPQSANSYDIIATLNRCQSLGKRGMQPPNLYTCNLLPPGVARAAIPSSPISVTYTNQHLVRDGVQMREAFLRSERDHCMRRLETMQSNKLQFFAPGVKNFAACINKQWAHTIECGLIPKFRVGSHGKYHKDETTVAHDALPIMPALDAASMHTLPDLKEAPNEYIDFKCSAPTLSRITKAEERSLVEFVFRLFEMHVQTAAREEEAAPVSAVVERTEHNPRKRRADTTIAPAKNELPIKAVLCAMIYWMNHCQNLGAGARMNTHQLNNYVSLIHERFFADHVGRKAPRSVCVMRPDSPLSSIAYSLRSAHLTDSVLTNTAPFLHVPIQ